jgi:hypothetical protein
MSGGMREACAGSPGVYVFVSRSRMRCVAQPTSWLPYWTVTHRQHGRTGRQAGRQAGRQKPGESRLLRCLSRASVNQFKNTHGSKAGVVALALAETRCGKSAICTLHLHMHLHLQPRVQKQKQKLKLKHA